MRLTSIVLLALFASIGAVPSRGVVPSPSAPMPFAPTALDRVVGNARAVVFGEDSHQMAAVHAIVPPMFEHLVTAKGFRVFVFEVQWGVTEGLNDFLHSDRTELDATEQYWLDGAFASRDIARMLMWIRDWNRAHPKDPITIYGYQPEQPVTDFKALFTLIDRVLPGSAAALRVAVAPCQAADPSLKTEFDFMAVRRVRTKAGQPSFTDAERAACLGALDRVDAAITAPEVAGRLSDADRTLARLHILSVRAYVDVLRKIADRFTIDKHIPDKEATAAQGEIYGRGDAARFAILRELRRLYFPREKVFYWMHNWHAARHASELDVLSGGGIPKGTVSLGERIAADAPQQTVTIGNIVPCRKTCTEPPASLEPAFDQRFGDRTTLIDLRNRRDSAGLGVDSAGTLFANHHGFGFANVVLARQFDAILYVPTTTVVRY